MILVDPRAGSKDLIAPLLRAGLPVEPATLDYGDLTFSGRGEKGAPLSIGIEHKSVGDFLSSLVDDRLVAQVSGMAEGYARRYLVIEGAWVERQGKLVRPAFGRVAAEYKGVPPALEVEKRLLSLSLRAGFTVEKCATQVDTVRFITALYRTWTDKDLDQHKSHLAIYHPDMDSRIGVPVSQFVETISTLPGMGRKWAQAAEAFFHGDLATAMGASAAIWALVYIPDGDGRLFGMKMAEKLVRAIR